MTAHYLVTSTYPVAPGTTALVHAAAGGVGQILVQMIALKGGTVIGTTGSSEKASMISDRGADHVLDSNTADLADRVRELTDGVGVDVVYDGVGRATFESSLAALRPRGLLALFGAASGVVPPFELDKALAAGSLYVTRPSLFHHIAERRELVGLFTVEGVARAGASVPG